MGDIVQLDMAQYRLLVAIRYLNASSDIYRGLQQQRGINDFHFLVTLRSFIEYTRRGVWFLVWASEEKLKRAEMLTFRDAGSPTLENMDAMLNEALGVGRVSQLMNKIPGINEPFLNCLHALTHGNPISVRMIAVGLDKIFNTEGLLARAEHELNIFRILLYRSTLGEDPNNILKMLSTIHNHPADVQANARIAAYLVKQSGKAILPINFQ